MSHMSFKDLNGNYNIFRPDRIAEALKPKGDGKGQGEEKKKKAKGKGRGWCFCRQREFASNE